MNGNRQWEPRNDRQKQFQNRGPGGNANRHFQNRGPGGNRHRGQQQQQGQQQGQQQVVNNRNNAQINAVAPAEVAPVAPINNANVKNNAQAQARSGATVPTNTNNASKVKEEAMTNVMMMRSRKAFSDALETIKKNPNLEIGILIIQKALYVGAIYIALMIATNYMSNLYIEEAIIEENKTPSIYGFVGVFGTLVFVFGLAAGAIAYMIGSTFGSQRALLQVINETMMFAILVTLMAAGAATVIQNKQYFLYEDDGLRSYRGLRDILFYQSMILSLLPYHRFM